MVKFGEVSICQSEVVITDDTEGRGLLASVQLKCTSDFQLALVTAIPRSTYLAHPCLLTYTQVGKHSRIFLCNMDGGRKLTHNLIRDSGIETK